MEELLLAKQKVIFINSTAATEGGALTVLIKFIELFSKCDRSNKFYVFTSYDKSKLNIKQDNIIIVNDIKGKKLIDRIKWDLSGIKKWSIKQGIYADIIFSTQNTGYSYFEGTRKIVYMHQVLPYFREKKWNPIKKDERILWFYKNIYKLLMEKTWDSRTKIIVQTEWIKKRVILQSKVPVNNVEVYNLFNLNNEIISKNNNKKNDYVTFIYPASMFIYKNHNILIETCEIINMKFKSISDKFEILFTLDEKTSKSQEYIRVLKEKKINNIKFIGIKTTDEMTKLYENVHCLIFPSYIESVGLPLLEAKQHKLDIIVSDLEYSRETLNGYLLATYVMWSDPEKWAQMIVNYVKSKMVSEKNDE